MVVNITIGICTALMAAAGIYCIFFLEKPGKSEPDDDKENARGKK